MDHLDVMSIEAFWRSYSGPDSNFDPDLSYDQVTGMINNYMSDLRGRKEEFDVIRGIMPNPAYSKTTKLAAAQALLEVHASDDIAPAQRLAQYVQTLEDPALGSGLKRCYREAARFFTDGQKEALESEIAKLKTKEKEKKKNVFFAFPSVDEIKRNAANFEKETLIRTIEMYIKNERQSLMRSPDSHKINAANALLKVINQKENPDTLIDHKSMFSSGDLQTYYLTALKVCGQRVKIPEQTIELVDPQPKPQPKSKIAALSMVDPAVRDSNAHMMLKNYIKDLEDRTNPFGMARTVLNQAQPLLKKLDINLRMDPFSRESKLAAAKALLDVINEKVTADSLSPHEETLNDGDLGDIYKAAQAVYGHAVKIPVRGGAVTERQFSPFSVKK